MVVYARGTGTNIIGVQSMHTSAYVEIKTSTVNGALYDIDRTMGEIVLGFTDLVNNKVNNRSFKVICESSTVTFGVIGKSITPNTTYYIVPGTITSDNTPSSPFEIPITQNMILFTGAIRYNGTIPSGASVSFNIHKNMSTDPVFSITLNSGEITKANENTSMDFTIGDTYDVRLITIGEVGNGVFSSTIGFY